ncbi:MAG TPA: hypothetical protein VIL74_07630 [Pyrinomonadaceae bacterium]|jgi:hypothetical protein
MEDEELIEREIVRTTEKFIEAVRDSNAQVVSQLAADLKYKFKTPWNVTVEDFGADRTRKPNILVRSLETAPYVYVKPNKARVVYERKSHFHLLNSDFQNGFMRDTYSYEKVDNNWKLVHLKTEVRRFSGYELKNSLLGLLECLFHKAMKRKWKIRT